MRSTVLPCLLDVAMHGVLGIALHLKQLLSCFDCQRAQESTVTTVQSNEHDAACSQAHLECKTNDYKGHACAGSRHTQSARPVALGL